MNRQADDAGSGEERPKRRAVKKRDTPPRDHAHEQASQGGLPPYWVMLHHDNAHDARFVERAITDVTPLNAERAKRIAREANSRGRAIVLIAHLERAEFYLERLLGRGLSATIEPGV